jgi:hypothetical protein
MTWNELISTLSSIPEDRREETALFMLRDQDMEPEQLFEIDSREEIDLENVPGVNVHWGNDETETSFVIAM